MQEGRFEPPSAFAPDLPSELEAIALRALSLSPEDRFQTARDMAGAIARVLLARQELVDNASVEQTLAHLLGRDLAAPVLDTQPRTLAAVRVPRGQSGADVEHTPTGQGRTGGPRPVREVRHVALLALRIQGVDELCASRGDLEARARFTAIRGILTTSPTSAARCWPGRRSPTRSPRGFAVARAVVGLMANPSRAAADAAWLAVDVHEALAGASEDFPVPLVASIGIVRGIASGERDAQGHLVDHALSTPAGYLAGRVGTPRPSARPGSRAASTAWCAAISAGGTRRRSTWERAPPPTCRGRCGPTCWSARSPARSGSTSSR